jgi:hypothetical protein
MPTDIDPGSRDSDLMHVVKLLPVEFLGVPYSGAMIPGQQAGLGFTHGANRLRFAYAVLG